MKTVIILGMHSTGTSLVAGILSNLGVDMGGGKGRKFLKRNEFNPVGHFEDINFIKLNQQILSKAGGIWYDPPTQKSIILQKEKFENEIRNILRDKTSLWGWKDPRTSLTIELYLPYLKNVFFIVCKREHQLTARSLYKKNRFKPKEAFRLIKLYETSIENFFKKFPNSKRLNIHYGNLMKNHKEEVTRIINFLDIEISKEQFRKALGLILPKEILRKKSKQVKYINILTQPWKKIPKIISRKIKRT